MLIIFDCDGVLVDSEPLANQILAEYLSELGLPHTGAECQARYVGRSIPSVMAEIENDSGVKLPADFHAELWRRDQIAFAGRLHAIAGVADEIRKLVDAARPICVASSSAPERIRNSLSVTGLIDFFDGKLFSAAQVVHGKPAPDLFLLAASRMGVAPERCVVIEDSVAGITAARAAGMRALGFTGGGHCGPDDGARLRQAGAHAVFDAMAMLGELL